ncbi:MULTISPECIES: DUF2252 domain-containing protein [Paraburkholderia]|uniref:Uncharacterized conserved protein, DUF2252 family n=1 Tax=Paraburkholderia tropica TaxID=92647 RepID=A0AAQ1GB93_9BURK|nr:MULTISPECIES: DUF2252 domain-containing protein [Paraburkholderia]MBB2998672.1 uncharacterized protein (DUF2252 family) [Paraburkholderia tropica]MBB6318553.1 uncharacterized protein (DUF2252 family) [Paraburkholderia tropica]MDE1139470.1 DUF2252 domain-containing protein [Paraburkholderia tropica]PXX19920.1 uncharacterized protein (DUF2252 family) [Paraburkholderia tropica]PZW88861.1 uncharacterized protein (DUF2252 family) [Paraburkholderia tropica]
MNGKTVAEREAAGRAARERAKRSSHKQTGELHRDPLKLLEASSEGRVPNLVPLRYGRMIVSPFTFFRGSAILQAHDLAQVPNTGMVMQICGDGHLLNFGGFATPERQLVFDLNDFDEVAPGPWEWDLKRLVASFVVAARHMRYSRGVAEDLVMTVVNTYRDRMRQYADYGALELWYDKITFDRMVETALTPEGRRLIRRGMEKAAGRTHESMLEKLAHRDDASGHWIVRDAPPALFHVHGPNSLYEAEDNWLTFDDWRTLITPTYEAYLKTLAPDRRELLEHFALQDLVFKVVGVGSVGTRCLVILLVDHHGKPLFLQVKEARRSVISQFFKSPPFKHEAARVVQGQRLLQAASDIFLGWSTGPSGRHFYFRQLRDMKLSVDLELLDSTLLAGYGRLCGWAMARAHAKSGNAAIEIASYIGRSDQFAEALVGYGFAYADQVEKDYDLFVKAARSGKIRARSDEDMAADFRV